MAPLPVFASSIYSRTQVFSYPAIYLPTSLKSREHNQLCSKPTAPSESKQKEQLLRINPPVISTHPTDMAFLRLTPEDDVPKESATSPMDAKTNTSNTVPATPSLMNWINRLAMPKDIPRLDRNSRDDLWDDRWRHTKDFYNTMHRADQRREPVPEPTPCAESEAVRAKMQELRKEMVEVVEGYVAEMDKLRREDDDLLVMNSSPLPSNALKLVRE